VMLPLVHLGPVKDFWHEFDRYVAMEQGLASTFFVIPFKDDPGRTAAVQAPAMRASRYGASDIADRGSMLVGAGCEIGPHGIHAWMDSSKGREEQEQITRITGKEEIGILMK